MQTYRVRTMGGKTVVMGAAEMRIALKTGAVVSVKEIGQKQPINRREPDRSEPTPARVF